MLLLVGMGLILLGPLQSSFLSDTPYDITFAYPISLFLILRRILSGFLRRKWIQWLSKNIKNEKSMKTFLSLPGDTCELYEILVDGGPLGPGCAKLLDVFIGLVYCSIVGAYPFRDHVPDWKSFCGIGSLWPNWWLPGFVIILSLTVNGVLWIWSSSQQQSRGAHEGVHRMVKGTISRTLSPSEHIVLLGWSLLNATCEEINSRGFNRWEFSMLLGSERSVGDPFSSFQYKDSSNMWQATTFGLAHFYGVPSGWNGVLLTFVYGWLMAILQDVGGGLLYPILTHTIADYFIFSQIARRR